MLYYVPPNIFLNSILEKIFRFYYCFLDIYILIVLIRRNLCILYLHISKNIGIVYYILSFIQSIGLTFSKAVKKFVSIEDEEASSTFNFK